MRWRGRRESSNVEDRTGGGGGGFRMPGGLGRGRIGMPRGGSVRRAGGGLSLGTIILLVVLFFGLRACGIDIGGLLGGGGGSLVPSGNPQVQLPQSQNAPRTQTTSRTGTQDEMLSFISVVLAETEDVWNGIFKQNGQTYPEPRLVRFSNQVRSACGFASAASGPFYCPGDSKIYLDTSFFRELATRFNAAGDFAQAYVIAHEVGHHVQNVIGVLPRFNQMRRSMSQRDVNAMSVRVELQADCFAGIWAHYTAQKGLLEEGDLQEALNAATQIGDDAIQKRTQGYIVPESFNHGTSEQRREWFSRGYRSGRVQDCDTKVFG